MSWRTREVIGEGIRSFRAGRVFAAALCCFLAVILATSLLVESRFVSQLVHDEAEWVDKGGTLLIATSADGQIGALSCERLNAVQGVQAAFGTRLVPERSPLLTAPDASVSAVVATSSASAFFEASGVGALVSQELADQLGASADFVGLAAPDGTGAAGVDGSSGGQDVSAAPPGGAYPVADYVDTSLLGEEYGGAVLLVGAVQGEVDKCFIRAAPPVVDTVRAVVSASLESSKGPVIVSDRRISGEFTRDFSVEFAERPTKYAPFGAGALCALVWVMVRWFRRGEDGLYGAVGLNFWGRQLLRATELLVLLGFASVLGWAMFLVAAHLMELSSGLILARAAWALAIAVGVATFLGVLGGMVVRGRDTLSVLKDRG